jgi:hypothetical protein
MSIVTYNNRSIANISAIPGAAKSLTHIKTLTASSSATITFLNGSSDVVLDSTYPIYLFKWINAHPATDDTRLEIQGTTDGSNYNTAATTTFFRGQHRENDSATALSYETSHDEAQTTGFIDIDASIGNDNDQSTSGELFLFNPSSTTFVKHFLSTSNSIFSSDGTSNTFVGGYFNTTSAITGIQFKQSSGNIDAGTIKMYGLKDS